MDEDYECFKDRFHLKETDTVFVAMDKLFQEKEYLKNIIPARTNYGKVISLLYRALYSDYVLTDENLIEIIDYIMKEYI